MSKLFGKHRFSQIASVHTAVGYEGNLVAEAIDWYRLCDRVNISPQQFRRLTDLALRLSPNGGGLLALLNFVDPGAGFIWDMIPDPANVDGAIIKAYVFQIASA
jgi:hypothetical protein